METLGNQAENAVGSAQDRSPHTAHARTKRSFRRISLVLLINLINVDFLLLASQHLTPAQTKLQENVSSPLIGHPAPDCTLSRLDSASAATLPLAHLKVHHWSLSIAPKRSPKVPLKKSPGWGILRWRFRVPV
ncbi:hypothetical protein [Dictyobacter formicarum]|uniref:hypothetical protein n=1 Tax=Dictyobacter formicarum TaxID=2778368 RepID=UPI0019159B14|nr:hypothetical protein [Dictyobacter formicarum]